MKHCEGCNGNCYDEKLLNIAKKYEGKSSDIIEALHEVQNLYGYISEDAQKCLSKYLNVPMSEIYGIITFYSRFTLKPKGKYNIQICLGTACYVKGSATILAAFEEVRCIGACGLAPAIVVNEDVYGKMTADKVREIIEKYKKM